MNEEHSKPIIHKDIQYFNILYENFFSPLVHFAQGILYDEEEAKDIVQDVFLDLWNNSHKIKVEYTLKTFLFTCVKYKSYNRLRYLKLMDKHQDQIKEAYLFSYEMDSLADEDIVVLKNVLNNFPPQMKKVVTLHAYEGLKYGEISKELGISLNTVKTHLKRAYQKFRDELFKDIALIIYILSCLK